jgi:hypothetical protein
VFTVGRDEYVIREAIGAQESEDKHLDQLYMDEIAIATFRGHMSKPPNPPFTLKITLDITGGPTLRVIGLVTIYIHREKA